MELAGELAVMIRDLRAGAPATRVAEKANVSARLESHAGVGHHQLSELDEVIAASARSELRPGAILHLRGDGGHRPIGGPDVVLAWGSKHPRNTELGFTLER